MTAEGEYELVLTAPPRQALTDRLPEAVATAGIDFLASARIQQPRGVGKPLRGDLAGIWSARRGTYRMLSRLVEPSHEVVVLRSSTDATSTGREGLLPITSLNT